jgi:hypothetical protein
MDLLLDSVTIDECMFNLLYHETFRKLPTNDLYSNNLNLHFTMYNIAEECSIRNIPEEILNSLDNQLELNEINEGEYIHNCEILKNIHRFSELSKKKSLYAIRTVNNTKYAIFCSRQDFYIINEYKRRQNTVIYVRLCL